VRPIKGRVGDADFFDDLAFMVRDSDLNLPLEDIDA
jgi:hypothetical protein